MIDGPLIDLFIHGTPVQGGSKVFIPARRSDGSLITKPFFSKKYGKVIDRVIGVYKDDAEGHDEWMETVKRSARRQYRGEPLACPLRVVYVFHIGYRKYHYIAGRPSRGLKPEFLDAVGPLGPPDVDKFIRSTQDALTGILWKDDSVIVDCRGVKRWKLPSEPTGCRVLVSREIPEFAAEGLFAQEAL